MASDSFLDHVDQDCRRTCPSCNLRMSSIVHDRHSKCAACCGNECSFENRCSECKTSSDDVMNKYVKHRRSLDSKNRKNKKPDKDESRLRSSSGESNATPLSFSVPYSGGGGLSESRVLELMSQLSGSLAASMEASFINMES